MARYVKVLESDSTVPRVAGVPAEWMDVDAIIDARVPSQLTDPLIYKGVIDCSANPNYPAADAGHVYLVSVAGKIGGASGVSVEVGDMFICKTDGTLAGTQAQRGTAWNVVQSNLLGPIPVKATGAEIDTGTDDAKYVTPKAIADSSLGGGGGITNSAGANVVPKSDGTNLVASQIEDDGTALGIHGSPVTLHAPGGATAAFSDTEFVMFPGGTISLDADGTVEASRVLMPGAGGSVDTRGGTLVLGDAASMGNSTHATIDDAAKTITATASTESFAIDGVAHTITMQAANGVIIVPPTADPHIVGALWNNAGTLAISAG